MSPQQETFDDAKARLHDLEHAVAEAEAARAASPDDADAARKLAMTRAIRDAGKRAFDKAEAALRASLDGTFPPSGKGAT